MAFYTCTEEVSSCLTRDTLTMKPWPIMITCNLIHSHKVKMAKRGPKDHWPSSEKMKPKCDMEVKTSKSEVMLGLHIELWSRTRKMRLAAFFLNQAHCCPCDNFRFAFCDSVFCEVANHFAKVHRTYAISLYLTYLYRQSLMSSVPTTLFKSFFQHGGHNLLLFPALGLHIEMCVSITSSAF